MYWDYDKRNIQKIGNIQLDFEDNTYSNIILQSSIWWIFM